MKINLVKLLKTLTIEERRKLFELLKLEFLDDHSRLSTQNNREFPGERIEIEYEGTLKQW